MIRSLFQTVRLNCLSLAPPIGDSEMDGLVRGMERLTLADVPIQAPLPAKEGFDVSATATPPPRSSGTFDLSQSTAALINREADGEVVPAVPGHCLHSKSPRRPEGTPLKNFVSASSPPFRPVHPTPLRCSSIPIATIASATDQPSASRPCLTAIAVSLVYEVFACPDDEVQTWYPIGGGTLEVAATGRGLTLGATVEI